MASPQTGRETGRDRRLPHPIDYWRASDAAGCDIKNILFYTYEQFGSQARSKYCRLIQQAIIFGEQGKQGESQNILSQVKNKKSLSRVVSLASSRYTDTPSVNHERIPSADQVINEQLRAVLLAA